MGKSGNNKQNGPNSSKSKAQKAAEIIDKVGKVAGAIGKVAGTVSKTISLVNHPSWYTHYSSSNLVNMNLASKQNVAYKQTGVKINSGVNRYIAMPSVGRVAIQLTTPQGDLEGWKTGIRLIYQQLRTANSGRVNYSVQDVEKYILDVRALRAIDAWLQRLYKITYTFTSTNNIIPKGVLAACDCYPDSILSSAADLLQYVQRFHQMQRVMFPGQCDLFERAKWIYGNIFLDSNSQKPSYYVPTFTIGDRSSSNYHNGIFVYTYNGTSWQRFAGWGNDNADDPGLMTYSDVVSRAQSILDTLVDDNMLATIAADVVKAFGDRAFESEEVVKIDDAVTPIYDETVLNQFQNAAIASYESIGLRAYGPDVIFANTLYDEDVASGNSWVQSSLHNTPSTSYNATVLANVLDRFNDQLVNWHADKISAGEIMSITRFMPSNAELGSNGYDMYFNTFGTEIVSSIFAVVQLTDSYNVNVKLNEEYFFVPFAGLLYTGAGDQANGAWVATASFIWANFDWAPRYQVIGKVTGGPVLSPAVLDWDVFAAVNGEHLRTYFSYGNQSLLYMGASQNQSNTRVYGHNSKGRTGSRAKHNESKVAEPDKQ